MSKREDAYEFIRKRILDGTLGCGSVTSEREIEALAVLAATGLIEQVPQDGALIRTIDAAEAVRTLRLRRGMEEAMVDELATHEQPEIREIEQAFRRMDDAVAGNSSAFQLADTEFHVAIALAAGYFSARTSLEGFRDRIHVYRLDGGLDKGAAQATLNEHHALLEQILARNREAAVAALHEHLAASAERIVPGLSKVTFHSTAPMEIAELQEVATAAADANAVA